MKKGVVEFDLEICLLPTVDMIGMLCSIFLGIKHKLFPFQAYGVNGVKETSGNLSESVKRYLRLPICDVTTVDTYL